MDWLGMMETLTITRKQGEIIYELLRSNCENENRVLTEKEWFVYTNLKEQLAENQEDTIKIMKKQGQTLLELLGSITKKRLFTEEEAIIFINLKHQIEQ